MRPRCASWILCAITLASGQPGWSQPVDTDKTLKESNASAAYEDRLIDAGNLSPLLTDAEETSYNPAGWPRTWRIETFVSTFDQGGAIRHENGLTLSGRLDTPDYGALSLDSTLRSSPNSSIFTLSQRRMPFDNGWWANNGVGILNTLGIELSRHQYRFYVPTFPMAGAASEWLHDGNFQFQASVGEPGLYNGLRVSGFSRLGGNLFASGAEWAISPHWLAGLQVINVHGVRSGLDASAPDARTSVWSGYGSAAWQSGCKPGTAISGSRHRSG